MSIIDQIKTGMQLNRINNERLKAEVPLYWIYMQVLGLGWVALMIGSFLSGIYIGMQVR